MMSPAPQPPAWWDAFHRALRTFVQGAIAAVGVALAQWVASGVPPLEWTRAYWIHILYALGTVILTALLSYAARFLIPPKVSTETYRPKGLTEHV